MPRSCDPDQSPSEQPTSANSQICVPAAETLGVLVYLAENNQALSGSARRMLETWDEGSSKAVAGDPKTPKEILDYWLKPENIRPALLPILAENPSVELSKLSQLADQLTGDAREVLANSRRLKASRLSSENPTHQAQAEAATPNASEGSADTSLGVPGSRAETVAHENSETLAGKEPEASEADGEAEKVLISFSTEHAAEIASQEEKPFQPLGGLSEPLPLEAGAQAAAAAAVSGAAPSPAPARAAMVKKPANVEDERRGSVLQKIAKLDIKGRIQLAIKGTKEERSLLVRDGTKIVALAVLESPKITDSEVEKFATQKNVLEALLRAIPLRRRFAKNYAIVRNLAFNPRTPIDVSLGLIKNLLLADLKNLSGNKEVSDTIRKLALRMFKQKQQASKKD